MDTITQAILDNDAALLRRLLDEDKTYVTRIFDTERLFSEKIFHWIYSGDTALHLASAAYRVDLIKLLLHAGANVNASYNRRRGTPLHYAADGYIGGDTFNPMQQVSTLKLLLEAGADINAQDKNGATALHRATRTRCAEAVKFLLAAGADAQLRNSSGSSPFHLAVQNTGRGGSGESVARLAQAHIIESFLQQGVSPNLRDGKCQTVIDCARSNWVREALMGRNLR